ncbi:MAG: TRAP transporter large permease [Bacteroidia bacterium]|nr:TRAP transporter large permease [Bacteroidia bacterium]
MNISAVLIIIMLVLMFFKTPVFVSILSATSLYFFFTGAKNVMIVQRFMAGVESIPLLAIPFFVGMGVFMNRSGISQRIMAFASVCVGRISGGLAQVNVLLSAFMGGISGSNLADAAMQAKIMVPEMRRTGYSNEFSSVVTAMSSLITPLIPPGIGMIMYASVTNVSVGKLFVAGLTVGIMLTIAEMLLTGFIAKKRKYTSMRTSRVSFVEFWTALQGAFIPLLLPIVIIGGVRIGAFTASEAGAVGILIAIILGFFYRHMSVRDLIEGFKETVLSSATILLIIGAANALSWTFTKEQIPQALTQAIVSAFPNKYVFLFAINLFLLIIGMLIEGNAITIVVAPLLYPIAMAFGIDEIHFAMIFIFNLSIGAISPPMGTVMYVTCGITKCKIQAFLKEAIPYFIMIAGLLFLITYIPVISTGLVNLIY